jgi:hypothetical protein
MKKRENKLEKTAKIKLRLEKGKTFLLFLVSCFLLLNLTSCSSEIKDNSERFKIGVFEIPEGKGFVKETIIRKDSIQISKYGKEVDTLSIKWKNNFFYTLRYTNPKNELQKEPMFVQINKVNRESYEFTVKIGFSKYSNKGTIYKIK